MRPPVRASAVVLVLAVLIAGTGTTLWGLPKVRHRLTADDLAPGLALVAPGLRGSVALGDAVYVRFDTGGLVIQRGPTEVWRGVANGSPVTAGVGRLDWPSDAAATSAPRAQTRLTRSLGNIQITERVITAQEVTYRGMIFERAATDISALPVRITVTRGESDSALILTVDVPGADVVVTHGFRSAWYDYQGLGTQRTSPLTDDDYITWPHIDATGPPGEVAARASAIPVIRNANGATYAVDSTALTTVDLRRRGRLDTIVWDDRVRTRIYDSGWAQTRLEHSTDLGRSPRLPDWATSGALVGVRGSGNIRIALSALKNAKAAVAGVVVRDGGQDRYSDWPQLSAELATHDIRVITGVSPALAVQPNVSTPGEENLLQEARSQDFLVTDAERRPIRVTVRAADGTPVLAELVDLADSTAAAWYTQVLADRMRADRLSGWLIEGGAEYPITASGPNPVLERITWPSRLADVARNACVAAEVPDCLIMQDTANESTATAATTIGTGDEVAGWSTDGLAGAYAAMMNAGASGMPMTHSSVGGRREVTRWWGRDDTRTNELLQRWTELQVFGPILRTDEGEQPDTLPQVWNSPVRLAAFARMTQIHAAFSSYRKVTASQASGDGLPVVRPVLTSDGDPVPQRDDEAAFSFGDSFVIAPVLRPGARLVSVTLPAGRWQEVLTGQVHVVHVGSTAVTPTSEVERSAQKAGSITINAPLGSPVILARVDDPANLAARNALRDADLLG
ncbi:MAG: TIM-barrel domain-containing protein [Actinomycetota bacterium]